MYHDGHTFNRSADSLERELRSKRDRPVDLFTDGKLTGWHC